MLLLIPPHQKRQNVTRSQLARTCKLSVQLRKRLLAETKVACGSADIHAVDENVDTRDKRHEKSEGSEEH
jgi:hypothetical protein